MSGVDPRQCHAVGRLLGIDRLGDREVVLGTLQSRRAPTPPARRRARRTSRPARARSTGESAARRPRSRPFCRAIVPADAARIGAQRVEVARRVRGHAAPPAGSVAAHRWRRATSRARTDRGRPSTIAAAISQAPPAAHPASRSQSLPPPASAAEAPAARSAAAARGRRRSAPAQRARHAQEAQRRARQGGHLPEPVHRAVDQPHDQRRAARRRPRRAQSNASPRRRARSASRSAATMNAGEQHEADAPVCASSRISRLWVQLRLLAARAAGDVVVGEVVLAEATDRMGQRRRRARRARSRSARCRHRRSAMPSRDLSGS